MRRPSLRNLAAVELPSGYRLRHYHHGDEEQWNEIIHDSFKFMETDFSSAVGTQPTFLPERVMFVACGEQLVATVCMILRADAEADRSPQETSNATAGNPTGLVGVVHMLGVRRAHQGKRLGYWVVLAVLHRMAAEGLEAAELGTDDWRLPALKTYLVAGFEPVLVHHNQRQRWRAVFEHLGMSAEAERRFGRILAGPVRAPSAAS